MNYVIIVHVRCTPRHLSLLQLALKCKNLRVAGAWDGDTWARSNTLSNINELKRNKNRPSVKSTNLLIKVSRVILLI